MLVIALAGCMCTHLKIFGKGDIEGLHDMIIMLLMPVMVLTHITKAFFIADVALWSSAILVTIVTTLLTKSKFYDSKLLLLMIVSSFKDNIEHASIQSGNTYYTTGVNRAISFIIISYLTELVMVKAKEYFTSEVEDEKTTGYKQLREEQNNDDTVDGLQTESKLLKFFHWLDPSIIAFGIGLVFSNLEIVKTALTQPSGVLNETVFKSCEIMSGPVKIMSIFVFGAKLYTYKIQVFNPNRLLYLLKNFVIGTMIYFIGLYIVFYWVFQSFQLITDPVIILMLLFLLAEPVSLGLMAVLDDDDAKRDDMTTHFIQHLVGLVMFTTTNSFFLFLIADHYVVHAADTHIDKGQTVTLDITSLFE